MRPHPALARFDIAPPTGIDALPSGALLALGALGAIFVIVLFVRRGSRR